MALISVVIPVYNEEACLEPLFERLLAVSNLDDNEYEFLFVNDGSTDKSGGILQQLATTHDSVKYISFSRNFGHEAATSAGMDHASGDDDGSPR